MFDLTAERETTDGEVVTETYEGCVDYMDPPGSAPPKVQFKQDGEWESLDGFDRIARVESPLKP